jgi:hypothetical protein
MSSALSSSPSQLDADSLNVLAQGCDIALSVLPDGGAVLEQFESVDSSCWPQKCQLLTMLSLVDDPILGVANDSGHHIQAHSSTASEISPRSLAHEPPAHEFPREQLAEVKDSTNSTSAHTQPHLFGVPPLPQLQLLLRGSMILSHNTVLNHLVAYDQVWRILQESYGEVGALIGQKHAFSCARDITSAFVDSAAQLCFLSGPSGCDNSVISIAVAFLLLMCGKVRSVVVCCDKREQHITSLKMTRMTCDAATAYIAAANLPLTAKSIFIDNIQKLFNCHDNFSIHFVPTNEADGWCDVSDAFVVWDTPLPTSPTLAIKLKQLSCALLVSRLPLSLAQDCDSSGLVPIIKLSLEQKIELLYSEINELMFKIKQLQLQLQGDTNALAKDSSAF